MEKVVRDGKVAVLVSPGFGGGWYTWNKDFENSKRLLFHPKLVELVEQDRRDEITQELCQEILEINYDICISSNVDQLEIQWIPEGALFAIYNYDGYEEILTGEDLIIA